MGRILAFLCLLLVPLADAAANDAEDKYLALLSAAKQNAGPVDWQALRFAYADSPDFDLMGDRTEAIRHEMIQAFNKDDFATALAKAKLIIDQAYIDLDAHWVAAAAHKHLGDVPAAQKEHDITAALMKSIMTGDGSTQETAFTVITVHEEYALLHILGLDVTRQTLVNENGHGYDLMSTVDGDGKTRDFYFKIDRVLAAEARLLTPQP
jgi:uncharacterized protein DUF4919